MKKLSFFFLIFICSCTSSFEDKMIKCVKQHVEDSKLEIDVNEIYDDWDYMYIFMECASYDDVVNIIGKTNYIHDSSCDIVFEKEGKIVKYVQLFPYEGWPNESKNLIRFHFVSSCYRKFKKDEAYFKIEKYNSTYILSPIEIPFDYKSK